MAYSDRYPDCVWTDFSILKNFMKDAFIKLGTSVDQAEIIAEVLISADKKGIDSHGIGRFKPIYIDRIEQKILNPVTVIDIVKETETTAVIDGNNGLGHVVAKKATEMAIEKAQQHGLGMTVVRNSTHYGIAGYYTDLCAANDMIGISGTNARPSIAPTFGVENMLGTNPLTIGIPTDEDFYFSIDCATSV
ncbi:MAG TPA: Ldh family oxidoreductase, partial [bacterium]|nr:Ldh family oxidoreductase [bacterium]